MGDERERDRGSERQNEGRVVRSVANEEGEVILILLERGETMRVVG